MSQLRVHPRIGQGLYLARAVAQGFRLYHDLHVDGHTPFYLMSIIEDNLPARRLLTSGLPGYPQAQEYARLNTYAIYPVRHKAALALPHALRLARGSAAYREEIVACLNRNGARRQFSPYWTTDSLFTSNLAPSDFFLALEGECVVGCLACWDQNRFKQTVLRGYGGPLKRWRRLANLFSRLGGWPFLPEPGTALRHSYASHIAIDGDDPAVFAALLRAVHNHNLDLQYSYFVIGLTESNPLSAVVKSYRPLTYTSQLYLVAWEDGQSAINSIDHGLIPAPEIALM